MGAVFITARVSADKDLHALRQWFAEVKAEAQYESGHGGYTGTWAEVSGIKIADYAPDFATADEVWEWLMDNAQKWREAIAVKFNDDYLIGAWASS